MKKTAFLSALLLCGSICMTSCTKTNGTAGSEAATDSVALADEDMTAKTDATVGKLTDISLPDINGKSHSLLEEVKKSPLTLIDFWASWCGPCMREMPNVKDIYGRFKVNGFNIIGLSLDNDRDAWQQAVNNMGLEWLQLSDLKGWESLAAQTYGVEAIPYTLLVNGEGEILHTGLRGEELRQTVQDFMIDLEDKALEQINF